MLVTDFSHVSEERCWRRKKEEKNTTKEKIYATYKTRKHNKKKLTCRLSHNSMLKKKLSI